MSFPVSLNWYFYSFTDVSDEYRHLLLPGMMNETFSSIALEDCPALGRFLPHRRSVSFIPAEATGDWSAGPRLARDFPFGGFCGMGGEGLAVTQVAKSPLTFVIFQSVVINNELLLAFFWGSLTDSLSFSFYT